MPNCCKCDMHVCWERIYDWMEHFHRDPVANVVIYSAISLFLGFVSIALGTALYVTMDITCSLEASDRSENSPN